MGSGHQGGRPVRRLIHDGSTTDPPQRVWRDNRQLFPPDLSAMHVLLLEDDIDLGQAVTDHLEAAGHTVHWCKLIAQARTAPPGAFALLDLQLPDGDALDRTCRCWC